jgi:hypothetical protein
MRARHAAGVRARPRDECHIGAAARHAQRRGLPQRANRSATYDLNQQLPSQYDSCFSKKNAVYAVGYIDVNSTNGRSLGEGVPQLAIPGAPHRDTAATLRYTQPTISSQRASLKQALGARLVARGCAGESATPTTAGDVLHHMPELIERPGRSAAQATRSTAFARDWGGAS